HQPDWLSIMVGINDIHRMLLNIQESMVTPQDFADIYDTILARVKKETKANLILVDPFFISQERSPTSFRHKVLEGLPAYISTVHKMARKYKARHVKMHDLFQQQLKHVPADRFCPEPVHPNTSGHLVMAHAWLKAMGW